MWDDEYSSPLSHAHTEKTKKYKDKGQVHHKDKPKRAPSGVSDVGGGTGSSSREKWEHAVKKMKKEKKGGHHHEKKRHSKMPGSGDVSPVGGGRGRGKSHASNAFGGGMGDGHHKKHKSK